MFKKRWVAAVIGVFLFTIVWNYPSTYRIGVNGDILEKKAPLYAKACGFLYRDWMYKDIVDEVAGEEKDDLKRVLAIFGWVKENVRTGIPEGLKYIDDHPLNIIIRQYGTKGQIEDIFTILCSYAGVKAGVKKCYGHTRDRHIALSFVLVDGRWLIFDAARNKYFFNKDGAIGSVEDYYSGDLVMSDEDGAYYKEFLDDSKGMRPESFIRVEGQMPIKRIPAQIKKIFTKWGKNNKEDIAI